MVVKVKDLVNNCLVIILSSSVAQIVNDFEVGNRVLSSDNTPKNSYDNKKFKGGDGVAVDTDSSKYNNYGSMAWEDRWYK